MINLWKRMALLTAGLLLCLPIALRAQAILDIREIARISGKSIPVDSSGLAIVDINNKLEIRPNAAAIRAKALEVSGQAAGGLLLRDKIDRIEKILRNQQQIVAYIQHALANPGQKPADSLLLLLRQTTGDIRRDSVLRPDFNTYNREFNELLRRDPQTKEDRFLYALGRFNERLDSVRLDLRNLENSARVQFSLRAFRKDKSGGARLHVENFDLFEQGEFYNVENWVLSFSPEQIEQLQRYRELADTLNLGTAQALQSFKRQLENMLPALDCLKKMPQELKLAAETVPTDVRNLIDKSLADVQAQIDQLTNELIDLSPGQPFDALERFAALREQLDTIVEQTKRGFANLPESNEHLRAIRGCFLQTKEDVAKIQTFVEGFPAKYLRRVYLATDTLAKEVLAFDLDQIPAVGALDLQYTGRREAGDELLIQALFVPKDDTINRARNFTVIAERELKMIQTGLHSNTKIGILMAQPYTLEQDDVAKFRFTPSAALLLKKGSRNSHFYNNFLDPGVGIVTSSPDFDRDGVPEFAAGITGTIFRDILSIGWCWNFGIDKPFYFLGVHLPFNLPGFPVNPVQSSPPPGN